MAYTKCTSVIGYHLLCKHNLFTVNIILLIYQTQKWFENANRKILDDRDKIIGSGALNVLRLEQI